MSVNKFNAEGYHDPTVYEALTNIEKEIRRTENAQIEWLHIDVMDGVFVDNITYGNNVVAAMRKVSNIYFDTHLMVTDPTFWVDQMIDIKCDYICMHEEVLNGLAFRLIDKIHDAGLKAGIVLNPETPVSAILPYIDLLVSYTP